MRGRNWVWLGLLVLGGLGLLGYRAATTSLGITTGTSRDEVFYRFTASYTVDKTEKVSIDVVVGCSVELTNFRSGDTSVRVSCSPSHFPVRTKNNHVVLVQIPNRCYEVRQNYADLNQDVLPYVQWIESADDLLVGIGYMTEDAYASPLSRLTFEGMSIAEATREEWQAWRIKAAEGFVATPAIPEPWGFDDRHDHFARACSAVAFYTTPESLKDWLQSFWPVGDWKYWRPSFRTDMHERVHRRLVDYKNKYSGYPLPEFRNQRADHRGIGFRRNGARIPIVYPVRRSYHGRTWPELIEYDPTSVWQVDFDLSKRGFAYCDGREAGVDWAKNGPGALRKHIRSFPAMALVGNDLVTTGGSVSRPPTVDDAIDMILEDGYSVVLGRNGTFFEGAPTIF